MLKVKAIELLGGTVASAAKEIGVSYQAIDKWPEVLPPRTADRVLAAFARKHLPESLIGDQARPAVIVRDTHTPAPLVAIPGKGVIVDRRDPNRRSAYEGSDIDRRAPAQGAN
jgi:hypothetical protein